MAILTVTTTSDIGPGSFRDAIECANSLSGGVRIVFHIGRGPRTIRPLSPFPFIATPVEIDATEQPGYSGRPLIELDGCMAGPCAAGLHIRAAGATVRGFIVNSFSGDGIRLSGDKGCHIFGNYVGTDSAGKLARGNAQCGIAIVASEGNTIGGIEAGEANLVSGNTICGISIEGGTNRAIVGNPQDSDAARTAAVVNSYGGIEMQEATGNSIAGNLIGTDVTGTQPLGNGVSGVWIINAPGNTVGGSMPGARNVISGNWRGIIVAGPDAADNSIIGNYIGTDVTGTRGLGNIRTGLLVSNAPRTIIGGSAPGAGNVISANGRGGVNVDGSSVRHEKLTEAYRSRGIDCNFHGRGYALDTILQGNLIGTDATGTRALGNGLHGLLLYESQRSIIGGAAPGAANIISGNNRDGILLLGTDAARELDCTANVIVGNRIGTDITGSAAIPNMRCGVFISKASGNTVGGLAPGEGNVISANGEQGVRISGLTSFGNRILANMIGTDATGTMPLGNARDGIMLNDAPANFVGGSEAGAANVVGGNQRHGIMITGAEGRDNVIIGNHIGISLDGSPIGNAGYGIFLSSAASETMDMAALPAQNVTGSNGRQDVHVAGADRPPHSPLHPKPGAD